MQNAIRNFLFGSVVAVALAACGGESASGTASSSGESTGQKVVMGLDDSFPPMGFRNEKMSWLVSILIWLVKQPSVPA